MRFPGQRGNDQPAAPLALEPVAEAPRAARQYVKEQLTRLGHVELIETGVLGASELVTNACLHARTSLTVWVHLGPDEIPRIEVSDGSAVMPRQRPPSRTAATGRGLRLLSAAGRWGCDPQAAGGKTVWFEPGPEMDPTAFAFAVTDIDLDLP